MALQQTFTYKGIEVTNGYIKIVHWDGNKNNLHFNLEYYPSKIVADADINNENYLMISRMYTIVPDLESEDNIWVQAYDYLKTLPEFLDAVDC